jgi:peroxiredoxin/uncharacterized membrane protein YphA (DoxX/SURF4 family)
MAVAAGLLIARLALAIVFFLAGAAKLADRAGSQATLVDFGLPPSLASLFGVVVPVLEVGVAIALLPAASAGRGALGALILLGAFTLGIVTVLVRGRQADCRCFGQLYSSPVGWSTLARIVGLASITAFVLVWARERVSPSYLDWLSNLGRTEWIALFFSVLTLGLLAAGGWFGMHLMRQHGRILLRLDALERKLAERGIIAAQDGLPVGAQAPAFEAPNLHGGSTSLGALLAPGLPVLLVFNSTGCAACTAVLPDIARWQNDYGARVTVALISQGTLEENRVALAAAGVRHVLVQQAREIAEAFGAYVTPSAVLISRVGTVASSLAEGTIEVLALVGSIVPGPLTKQHLPGAAPMVSFDAG